MKAIEKDLVIAAPIEAVWAALTDADSVAAWMMDDSVEIDLRPGGAYSVFGGETTGSFLEVATPDRLSYTWRMAGWSPEWTDSTVTWTLASKGEGTRVRLSHGDFPNDEERIGHDSGWDDYWLTPMAAWLEGRE